MYYLKIVALNDIIGYQTSSIFAKLTKVLTERNVNIKRNFVSFFEFQRPWSNILCPLLWLPRISGRVTVLYNTVLEFDFKRM